MRELKKYGLRKSHKPKRHPLLSGVVQVCIPEGKTYSYILFSEDFVDAIGRALPFGVSPSSPAYLKAFRMPGRKTWRIMATYLDESRSTILWETDTPPAWLPSKYY